LKQDYRVKLDLDEVEALEKAYENIKRKKP